MLFLQSKICNAQKNIASFSFRLSDNLIIIPVAINGSEAKTFILDNGASFWVIDSSLTKKLAIATDSSSKVSGAGKGKVDVTYARNISFGLLGLKIEAPQVTIINLAGAVQGLQLEGLIGYEFFRQYVVRIDYHSQMIQLFDTATFTYKGNGLVIPLIFKKKQVYVKAKIKVAGHPQEEKEYLVDSGSSDQVNDELVAEASSAKNAVGGVGVGKQFGVKIGNIERFQLGKKVFTNLQGISGGQKIGSGLLHNFVVTFDYSHQRMILE